MYMPPGANTLHTFLIFHSRHRVKMLDQLNCKPVWQTLLGLERQSP